MDNKVRIIVVGLVVILLASLFFGMQALSSKQQVMKERDMLKEENSMLVKKAEDSAAQSRRLQSQLSALNDELQQRANQMQEVQRKYEAANRSKDELAAQLKSLQGRAQSMPPAQAAAAPMPESQDAYWAQVLKAKTELEAQVENLRVSLKNAEINSDELLRQKNAMELDVANLNRDKKDLARKIEYMQKQVENSKKMVEAISFELVGERNDKLQVEDILKAIRNENRRVRRTMQSLDERKIKMDRLLADVKERNNSLEQKCADIDILLQDKLIEISKLQKKLAGAAVGKPVSSAEAAEAVELPPIVVRPTQGRFAAEPGAALVGAVASVNKNHNFVVVDLGSDNGVKLGDILHVYKCSLPDSSPRKWSSQSRR